MSTLRKIPRTPDAQATPRKAATSMSNTPTAKQAEFRHRFTVLFGTLTCFYIASQLLYFHFADRLPSLASLFLSPTPYTRPALTAAYYGSPPVPSPEPLDIAVTGTLRSPGPAWNAVHYTNTNNTTGGGGGDSGSAASSPTFAADRLGFDRVYLINLDDRPDRLHGTQAMLEHLGITGYERLSAVSRADMEAHPVYRHHITEDMNAGRLACWSSHMHIYRELDDIDMESDIVAQTEVALADLEGVAWDLFYLGQCGGQFGVMGDKLMSGTGIDTFEQSGAFPAAAG
ncbi:hypothetical protein BJ085DRAFT_41034, partial [Dimargaris cristalligena]